MKNKFVKTNLMLLIMFGYSVSWGCRGCDEGGGWQEHPDVTMDSEEERGEIPDVHEIDYDIYEPNIDFNIDTDLCKGVTCSDHGSCVNNEGVAECVCDSGYRPEGLECVPDITIRKMAILGTCLPGCEQMWKDLGGTHFYGNRYGWPDYDEAERLGMKVFVNIRGEHGYPTEDEIRLRVEEWKDRPGCGGYWCDQLGHEPDITNPPLEERIRFFETVRLYDPDNRNHPVMEMFDMTEWDDFPENMYPGWQNAFSDRTHDLLLVDCYPSMQASDEEMIETMEQICWEKFVKNYPHEHQVIIQMFACDYRPGGIWTQYNFWKEKLASEEFENPYRGQIAVCWYKDECARTDEAMRQEIREVIEDAMR